MIRLLDSVPWFVIGVFAASAVLAIAAGGRSSADGPEQRAGSTTRIAGHVYAAVVAAIVVLWVREQWS